MPKATIKLTPEHVATALARYNRQSPAGLAVLALKAIGIVLFGLLALFALAGGRLLHMGFYVALGVIVLFIDRTGSWRLQRSVEESPYRDKDIEMEFTGDGVHIRSELDDKTIEWNAFARVVHFPDGFLLFEGPSKCHWIPVSSLAGPQQAGELAALLREKIPLHRTVGSAPDPAGSLRE